MGNDKQKAILAVSFGTSYPETGRKNLDAIESELGKSFPEYSVYRAWTSERIIEKRKRQEQVQTDTVEEAVVRMLADGVRICIVQPIFILDGEEHKKMKEQILPYKERFEHISFGAPLLSGAEDVELASAVAAEVLQEMDADAYPVFVLHEKIRDAKQIEKMIEAAKGSGKKKVVLVPFMLTAGYHVEKDLLGIHEGSWKSRFEQAGFEVQCIKRGLGEYSGIRKMYVRHAKQAERGYQESAKKQL